jgi:hypothetical protein
LSVARQPANSTAAQSRVPTTVSRVLLPLLLLLLHRQ